MDIFINEAGAAAKCFVGIQVMKNVQNVSPEDKLALHPYAVFKLAWLTFFLTDRLIVFLFRSVYSLDCGRI